MPNFLRKALTINKAFFSTAELGIAGNRFACDCDSGEFHHSNKDSRSLGCRGVVDDASAFDCPLGQGKAEERSSADRDWDPGLLVRH